MAKTDIWMPWFITDYMRDTGELTLEEDCFYRRALDQCWIRRGGIPVEPARLLGLLRVSAPQFKRCKWILERFFYRCEDGYRNSRLDVELVKAAARKEIAAENGRRGGRPKNPAGFQKETNGKPSGIPSGLAKQNPEHNPNHNPEKSSSPSPSPSSFPKEKNTPLPPKGGSVWGEFRATVQELFGKPTSHEAEIKQFRLANDLAALGASPEELRTRTAHYRLCWPDVACTLKAVLNNWNEIPALKPKGATNGTHRTTGAQRRDAEAEQFLRELGGSGQTDRGPTETDGDLSRAGNALSREAIPHGG